MRRGFLLAAVLVAAAAVIWLFRGRIRSLTLPSKPRTVSDVLTSIGPAVDQRLRPDFERAGLPYPPPKLTFLVFKREKRMDLQAADRTGHFHFVKSYPILAASGTEGPKLREGDSQVPEGYYRIELLNPNSRYHLSLRIDYPNTEDRTRALAEGRLPVGLGGDIMIHGGAASIGCLAMGDPAAEDLFILAARTGLDNLDVLIFPRDFRRDPLPPGSGDQGELLNQRLQRTLNNYHKQSVE